MNLHNLRLLLNVGFPKDPFWVLFRFRYICFQLGLFKKKKKNDISFHCYADDTQIYMPVKKESSSPGPLPACLSDLKTWLDDIFLHMNESKTEIIVFAPPNTYGSLKFDLGPLSIHGKSMVKKIRGTFWWVVKIWQTDQCCCQVRLFSIKNTDKGQAFQRDHVTLILSSLQGSRFKFYLSHTRLYRVCITSSEMWVRSAPRTVQIL